MASIKMLRQFMGQTLSSLIPTFIANLVKDKDNMIWKVLGGFLLLKYGISLIQFICLMFRLYVLPLFGMKLDLKKYGEWAVVTGATDGIGKAIAQQLVKRGLKVVLIGRSEEKLKSVAEELQSNGTVLKTIKYDYNKTDGYEKLGEQLEDLEIGVLVNNVGISFDHPDFYLQYDSEFYDSMVNINITSVLKMTRLVLDKMAKRKKGVVVHVSSASALFPVAFLTVYSASKVFVNYFGQGLALEYAKDGIISQVVNPLFVATKLSKLRPNGFTIPSAEVYAKQMLNAIGVTPSMTGYWAHELQVFVQSFLPECVLKRQTYNIMDKVRRRWVQKQQQKKE